ncbi:putative chloride channel-like protein CLC-g [Cocos nucifera]|uniref:Putative chloride channel-like protein CLC-g n=1 Tax=Cocos nucifera TaxID=13894 RepID=A0A8K0IPN4_COCNU|nr:putative chloride channel-like protein CLC-g [Cocos nucifera]
MAHREESDEEEEQREALREPLLEHLHSINLRRHAPNSTSQVAIIGSNLCPIESLDYEMIENDLFNQDWRSRGRAAILQYIFLKWTLCFLVGILAGAVGFFNNLAIENLAGIKFVAFSKLMLANK